MFRLFFGTDREKARAALNSALEKMIKNMDIVRITDAHTLADLQAALQGPGMFGAARVVVFDSILGGENEEMRTTLLESLERSSKSDEQFFILEGALDATTRKQVEKYAEKPEKFNAPKKKKDNSIF